MWQPSIIVVAIMALSQFVQSQLVFFNSTNAINADVTLSAGCEAALMANISCPEPLVDLATDGLVLNSDNVTVPQVCASTCSSSLAAFHSNVSTACKNDPNPWTGMPATWFGDLVWAYANRTCLTNNVTGAYCVDEVLSWWSTVDDNSTVLLTDLPSDNLCSPCMISLLAQAQSTSFSNYGSDLVDDWIAIQAECNITYPTDPQPPSANFTEAQLPNFVNTSALPPVPCMSGKTYTVQSGDTCEAIGISQNVASGSLLIINNLFADCSGLIAGASICLPPTCSIYQVQTNDTCWSVSAANNITVTQLQSWNPALNGGCTNILSGSTVCVSPPGGAWTGTTIPGTSPTQGSTYALTTVAPPGQTPYGTTSNCGSYYQAVSGDNCQKISLNQTITVPLFEAINPSINVNCTNLIPGLYYCVQPTLDWNLTAVNCTTATTATAPAPTLTGAASACYEWYTVQANDSCSLIEVEFGITFLELQAWNPSINSTCGNLELGAAYCVNALATSCNSTSSISLTSTTTSGSPTPTSTPPATTTTTSGIVTPTPYQPDMTSGCTQFYEAVANDSCAGIAASYNITLTEFYAWNPDVGTSCTALWANEWYCVAGPPVVSTTTTSAAATTTSPGATPTPHQPNMVSGCQVFYEAVSGDTCSSIATAYGITLTDFYTWNPDVGTDCSALWAQEWYCVGL